MSRLKTGVILDVSRYHGNEYLCLYLSFFDPFANSLGRSFDRKNLQFGGRISQSFSYLKDVSLKMASFRLRKDISRRICPIDMHFSVLVVLNELCVMNLGFSHIMDVLLVMR